MYTLYRIAALIAFVASALGCNQPQRSITQRSNQNGIDQLYSKVDIGAEGVRFRCLASASGSCHYTVFDGRCEHGAGCDSPPLRQLSVAVGQDRRVTDLPRDVQVCASEQAGPVDAHCQPTAQVHG